MPPARDLVGCPICSRQIPEADINLHLDLQCPGSGDAKPSISAQTSQSSLRSSPSQHVIELPDTPPNRRDGEASGSRQKSASVASIFAPRKRMKVESESADAGVPRVTDKLDSSKRSAPTSVAKAEVPEKKARVNPLIANQPLAERSRPISLERYVGQTDIVGPGSLLRARIEAGEGVGSCILWGPPGCGKTTLARLIAKTANAEFKELSATSAGTADVRQVFEQAKNGLKLTGRMTILMIDEIHRFNKPQQDLFLPYVENGWVQLIGATTENPSFKVNGALLSRCQVFTLSSHTPNSLVTILRNALNNLPDPAPDLPPDLLPFLAEVADGDARQALNGLELALKVCHTPQQSQLDGTTGGIREMTSDERKKRDTDLMEAVKRGLRKGYDRSGEERYDMISALHKSLRGSDGSAAMYWLARMLTGGEDPLYVARRLIVVASEDVGLADPHGLPLATATYQACQTIGMPECRINLAHCVAYLAEAPKSTRAYNAYKRAEAAATNPPLPGVPLQVRNAPTKLMKQLGYGKEYSYNPDFAHPVYNEYLPPELASHSTTSDTPGEHFLKSIEAEAEGKSWDDGRLTEWESKANRNVKWPGRRE